MSMRRVFALHPPHSKNRNTYDMELHVAWWPSPRQVVAVKQESSLDRSEIFTKLFTKLDFPTSKNRKRRWLLLLKTAITFHEQSRRRFASGSPSCLLKFLVYQRQSLRGLDHQATVARVHQYYSGQNVWPSYGIYTSRVKDEKPKGLYVNAP